MPIIPTKLNLFGANCNLTITGPVLPGQPIQLSWYISSSTFDTIGNGNVVATISNGNNVLYTSKPIAITKTLTKSGALALAHVFYQAGENNIILQFNPGQQNAQGLYVIGTHTLTLTVTGGNGPYTATTQLVVIGENINASWWNWTTPTTGAPANVPWNTAYGVAGNFFNQSQWSVMKSTCSLIETNTDNNMVVTRGTQSVTADIGANPNPVQYSAITQNWGWFSSPTGVHVAPVSKTFNYVVVMTLQDPWGNGYPPQNSNQLSVIVSVPQNKINDCSGASAASVAAVACAVGGAISGIFSFGIGAGIGAACAAACTALAANLLSSAADPPAPDFNYHLVTKPIIPTIPATTKLQQTLAFLNLSLHAVSTYDALSATEGKLIASRLDQNVDGINIQSSQYKILATQLITTANNLPESLTTAIAEITNAVNATPSLNIDNLRTTLRSWQANGIPVDVENAMVSSKLSTTTISILQSLIQSTNANTLPSLTDSLTTLANSISEHAQYVATNTDNIMAG